MSILNCAYFRDEEAAHSFLEGILWPSGPICPHCGAFGHAYKIKANPAKRVRHGLWKCAERECRKQFTVKMFTVFEHARLPLHICLQAAYLLCASKKGISSHQLSRMLDIDIKTAWFLSHRVREAMRHGSLRPMGGFGNIVEVDETFIGRDKDKPKRRGYHHKLKVLSLVDRATGQARSMVVDDLKTDTIVPIVRANLDRESRVVTDEAGHYNRLSDHFDGGHDMVNHSAEEYVNPERPEIHTNTIEGFFSVFKRGMRGVYQHCSEQHLHRYLAEFDFRYNNRAALHIDDPGRTIKALYGARGKRLTYKSADNLAS